MPKCRIRMKTDLIEVGMEIRQKGREITIFFPDFRGGGVKDAHISFHKSGIAHLKIIKDDLVKKYPLGSWSLKPKFSPEEIAEMVAFEPQGEDLLIFPPIIMPEHRIAIKEKLVEEIRRKEIVFRYQILDIIGLIHPFKCYIVKDKNILDFVRDFMKRFYCPEVSALSLESEKYARLVTVSRNQIMDIRLPIKKREIDINRLEKMLGIGFLGPAMKGVDILMKSFGDIIWKKIDKKKFDEIESILEKQLKRMKIIRK